MIEKSVWPHEACRVMAKGDPEGHIFLAYPHANNGFFYVNHCFYLSIYLCIYLFIYLFNNKLPEVFFYLIFFYFPSTIFQI